MTTRTTLQSLKSLRVTLASALASLPFAMHAASPVTAAPKNAGARLPNIVVIMADDLGYGDLSCYGAKAVTTPNVDRLASTGLRFTDGYCTAATCTPSRYSFLTGEYAFRQKGTHILAGTAAIIIKPGRTTLPSIFKGAGYTTGIVGKWHLGLGDGDLDWNKEIKPSPLDVGFDYSFIMAATADRVPCVYIENRRVVGLDPKDPLEVNYRRPFPEEPTGRDHRDSLKMDWSKKHNDSIVDGVSRLGYMKGGKSAIWKDEDMADTFTQKALAFIDREKAHPFFLYLATTNVHVPRIPNPRWVGKTTMGPRGDSIVEFDGCVGEVMSKIEQLGLSDNTLIVLTSDNGPVLDDGYKDGAVAKLGDHKPAGPLRGGKYSIQEGGTRVPFIVTWPTHIKPGVSDAIVSQVDFCASFAALVSVKPDTSTMPDSKNVLPALLGESKTGRSEVVEHAKSLALRAGNWKLIPKGTGSTGGKKKGKGTANMTELYDLSSDPGETKNVAAEHPDIVTKLSQQLKEITGNAENGSDEDGASD